MYLDLAANYLAIREGHLLSSEGEKGQRLFVARPAWPRGQQNGQSRPWTT